MPTPEGSQQDPFRSHSEWFAAFLRATNQKQVTKNAILSGLQTRTNIWARLVNPGFPFSTLYVGAGSGGVEVPLTLELIRARGTKQDLTVHCEDPSLEMKKQFEDASQKAGVWDVTGEYVLEPFESPVYDPPQVDFALASHAWYYIPQWRNIPASDNTLIKFGNTFKTAAGVGLITLQSKSSDNFRVRSKYSPILHGKDELAGEQILDEARRLGINAELIVIDATTEVNECFDRGKFAPTEEGDRLLSFILRFPWRDLPLDLQRQVADDLTQIVESNGAEKMMFRDTYLWMSAKN